MQTMTRKWLWIAPASLMLLLCTASLGWCAMGDIENLAFQGFADDVLGPGESAAPDGRPDATFSLSLRGVGAVSGFSLKSENGKSAWDTVAGNGVTGILVKDSSGNVIAGSDGGMKHTPLLLGMGITLTVPDDGSIARGGKFTVSARFIDDSEAHATIAIPPTKTQQTAGAVRIVSAQWIGRKSLDLTGPSQRMQGDGVPDDGIRLVLRGAGTLTRVTVRGAEDQSAVWDTDPRVSAGRIAVTQTGAALNNRDGSIETQVRGQTTLDLLLTDADGALAKGGKFAVIATFADGSRTQAEFSPQASGGEPSSQSVRILSARWADAKTRDLTGRGERLRGDGVPDESVRVMTQGAGTLTGVTVQGVEGERAVWDTVPANNARLVAVTKDGVTLNRPDGSISAPLRDRTVLELWMTDTGVIEKGESKLEVRFFLADGSVASRVIDRGAPQTPGDRDEFVGSAVLTGPSDRDLVGKGERRTGNGTKDWKIDLKVVNRGTITAVTVDTIAGPAGVWDTLAGNGRRLVGVTDSSGALLNREDGSVTIPVQKPTELRLWMEDYDVLADDGTRARVTLTYDDGRTLSREVVRRIETPEPTPTVAKPTPGAGGREILFSNPRRASSSDYVGTSEKLGKNKKADWLFDCEIRGEGRIEAIVAEAVGTPGVWDTIPGNGNWALGVVSPGKGLINRRDGSVSFYASQYPKIQLFFEDDGTMRQGASHFKITVTWSDGTKTSAES